VKETTLKRTYENGICVCNVCAHGTTAVQMQKNDKIFFQVEFNE